MISLGPSYVDAESIKPAETAAARFLSAQALLW